MNLSNVHTHAHTPPATRWVPCQLSERTTRTTKTRSQWVGTWDERTAAPTKTLLNTTTARKRMWGNKLRNKLNWLARVVKRSILLLCGGPGTLGFYFHARAPKSAPSARKTAAAMQHTGEGGGDRAGQASKQCEYPIKIWVAAEWNEMAPHVHIHSWWRRRFLLRGNILMLLLLVLPSLQSKCKIEIKWNVLKT